MADKVFPDNTVLCNFAAVQRLDLLRDWLSDRGRWTEAVENEARKSANHLRDLASLFHDGWLGESIAPETDAEEAAILRIRRIVFGGKDSEPTKHLGEAMTLVLIQERTGLRGSWWITDDRDAADLARHKGITTRDTMDIMCELVAEGTISSTEAFALMLMMNDRDRHLRMPDRRQDLE